MDTEKDLDFLKALPHVNYGCTGTTAYYDASTDTYYNLFGQILRDPAEYDTSDPEWSPMGDE